MEKELTSGGLFEGIGGFPLAATWAGIKPIWSNEIDPYCCKVLRKNFNHEIIEKDIRKIRKGSLRPVDIISGGVPCQPASIAGKRKGKDDDRWLWDENLRIVSDVKPVFGIFENPPGILSLENGKAFQGILLALENEGYEIEIFNIPACSVGAWHRRERIWIIAYSLSSGGLQYRKRETVQNINWNDKDEKSRRDIKQIGAGRSDQKQVVSDTDKTKRNRNLGGEKSESRKRLTNNSEDVSDTTSIRQSGSGKHERSSRSETNKNGQTNRIIYDGKRNKMQWDTEPELGRVATGISNRVDRLKGLGNAIVPQVAYEIFKAILNQKF